MHAKNARKRASEFLQVAHLYRLGILPTEQPHPETRELSRWVRDDLPRAVAILKSVDVDALNALQQYADEIDGLTRALQATIAGGGRVFLCGCGATGRLSLSLEYLWRAWHGSGDDRVRSFMAGGDIALVHALEGFEDHPAYGARHLQQMGFTDGDLLISCTEGGETPYVIGATEEAVRLSSNAPYFLYCNPDALLSRHIERFRRVYEHPNIHTLCLDVGPMALTGSTRMQASTVLQLAVGAALLHPEEPARDLIARFARRVDRTDFSFLTGFIEKESALYAAGHHVTYRVRHYGITVLTDTTERAPTFSLVPFAQFNGQHSHHSLCYVSLDDAETPAEAWTRLLNRVPRALNWPEVDPRTTPEQIDGFDFSSHARAQRRDQIPGKTHGEFHVYDSNDRLGLRLEELAHDVVVKDLPDLFRHLLLKQMLNIHSTLVMGRLGRYQDNLMTWVSPTNNKLVDRAARYVMLLLANDGCNGQGYGDVVQQLFAEMNAAEPDESVVLRTYRSLARRRQLKTSSAH